MYCVELFLFDLFPFELFPFELFPFELYTFHCLAQQVFENSTAPLLSANPSKNEPGGLKGSKSVLDRESQCQLFSTTRVQAS